jgi:SPP1 family predicted phage head-tail adaptor
MKMPAARRDRRITFMKAARTQDEYGGWTEGDFEPFATVWAEVQDILPSRAESVADGISMARRPCRIRILYRPDLTSDMQIEYAGRTLRIISGPAELGRRAGLEFMAEELSTMGNQP